MRIGVIGFDRLGETLAAWCAEGGHEVAFTSSQPQDARDRTDRLWVMPVPEVAAFGDAVIFATDWQSTLDVVDMTRQVIAGKVAVDASPSVATEPMAAGTEGRCGLETLMALAPEAHWVKALNTHPLDVLTRRRGHDPLLTEFMCTDMPDARATVCRIIQDLGFAPFYAGGARAARLTETNGPLQAREVDIQDATDILAKVLSAAGSRLRLS